MYWKLILIRVLLVTNLVLEAFLSYVSKTYISKTDDKREHYNSD
jgi:hypothetical protein